MALMSKGKDFQLHLLTNTGFTILTSHFRFLSSHTWAVSWIHSVYLLCLLLSCIRVMLVSGDFQWSSVQALWVTASLQRPSCYLDWHYSNGSPTVTLTDNRKRNISHLRSTHQLREVADYFNRQEFFLGLPVTVAAPAPLTHSVGFLIVSVVVHEEHVTRFYVVAKQDFRCHLLPPPLLPKESTFTCWGNIYCYSEDMQLHQVCVWCNR